jgi:hypothetical protein
MPQFVIEVVSEADGILETDLKHSIDFKAFEVSQTWATPPTPWGNCNSRGLRGGNSVMGKGWGLNFKKFLMRKDHQPKKIDNWWGREYLLGVP